LRALRIYLDDLEARIDPQQEDLLLLEWLTFTQDRCDGQFFSPRRSVASPPSVEWSPVSINAALEDFDLMALQQFGECSRALADGSGTMLNVRCNYGTSIIPSLFGLELLRMDEALNTLPTSRPFNDLDAIKRIVDAGVPNINQGYVSRVLEMAERYVAIAREYPKIGTYVHIYHPDLQGPMDICEIIWGSTMFFAFYDQPDLVQALLEIVTQTYIDCMRAWVDLVPFREGGNAHWGLYHQGNIMLRDDSAMNLSPAMYDEFVRPYDQRLLDQFGGGAVHFCGRGDHYIASLSEMEGLHALHMSQSEYNDMEIIYANTVDKGIKIIGLDRTTAEKAIAGGRNLHGQVHAL
jgi:hypothetical protein